MRLTPCLLLSIALLLLPAPDRPLHAEEERDPEPWFSNVTVAMGLGDVPAKDVVLADLDADGWWDLCVDRQRLYLNRARAGQRTYAPHTDSRLEFPTKRRVPLTAKGLPDLEKAKEQAYVPHYLYFADLDNDGHQDAVAGVKCWWEHFDGRAWRRVAEADPGVRTAVWLGSSKGRFRRAPPSAIGADDAVGPAMALALVDVDADGRLDLFEGREYRQYGQLQGCGIDRLWMGDGKGAFRDGTRAAGLWTGPQPYTGPMPPADPSVLMFSRPTYGVTHADWNDDGHQDLMALAYGRQWNALWRNNGDGTFTDVGLATGFAGDAITHGRYPDFARRPPERPFRSNGNTFDCAIGDLDGDGDLDALLGEITHFWAGEASDLPSLLLNRGAEGSFAFERLTVREAFPARTFRTPQQWNYGDLHTALLDVDNDGRLDVLIGSGDYPDGQHLRLYHQQDDGSFDEVTEMAGFDWEGCGGLSIGDIDRDGDVDIVAGRSFMRLNAAHRERYMGGLAVNTVGVFRNDVADRSGNHWLNVRLRGKGAGHANRSGIGARIRATAGGRTQIREIRAGSGLSNHQDPPEACFGLGAATVVERLEVRWPNRGHTWQVFENVPVDRFVLAREGVRRLTVEGPER